MDEMKPAPEMQPEVPASPKHEEPELYVEPTRMTRRDTLGVIAALVALVVIGISGYVWLNPKLGASNVLAVLPGRGAVKEQGETEVFKVGVDADEVRCPFCNMFAARSASYIVATMGDGTVQHFDSWDCVFKYSTEQDLPLVSAQVAKHGEEIGDPLWLTAAEASYLYDTTESIKGSMPPGVAAFESEADAKQAQEELGGSLLAFADLIAKWQFANYRPDMTVIPKTPGSAAEAAKQEAAESGDVLADPGSHTHDMGCPVCGMFANKSRTHVVVLWANGEHTHHDSFDCMFIHEKDNGMMLDQARVSAYSSRLESPSWLNAIQAFYLYGTREIEGSMPPYVAAYESRAQAEAARGELGGEVVDFAGLRKKWTD
jgi:nitrous oxide reductase accessory protein NosL